MFRCEWAPVDEEERPTERRAVDGDDDYIDEEVAVEQRKVTKMMGSQR